MKAIGSQGPWWGIVIATVLCLLSAPAAAQDYPSLSTPPQLEQTGQNDAALIVGIGDYIFLSDVDGVVETVNDWETFFVQGLGMSSSQVLTLLDERATKERMEDFAERAAEAVGPGGTLWFVFVGHGAPVSDGSDGVLVGVDAQTEPRSLEARGLKRSELVRILEEGAQAQTMVVIDACFSGRTPDGGALAEGLQIVVPERAAEHFQPAGSTVVMAAAQGQEFAGALPGTKRPAFSYVLLGALRGWASTSGVVTVSDAMHYTRQHLRHLDHRQTPDFNGADDLVLVRGATEEEPQLASLMQTALRGLREELVPQPTPRPTLARPEPEPMEPDRQRVDADRVLQVGNSYTRGTSNPELRIYMFPSFACPFSARAARTMDQVMERYGDRVQLVHKSFPLVFQGGAEEAARAALAAGEQGKFWEMHDALFANQQRIGEEDLVFELAGELGINLVRFRSDLNSAAIAAQVQAEQEEGQAMGIRGTPHFVVGDEIVAGAQSLESFEGIINRQLGGDALRRDRVVIYKYASFTCPFSARVARTLREVMEEYGDRVELEAMSFPLPFQEGSERAAKAAIAAGYQGRYFEMYEALYENQRRLDDDDTVLALARELGLDMDRFRRDLNSTAVKAQVKREQERGHSLGVRGTPHFIIGDEEVTGAQSAQVFREAIERQLGR